MTMGHVELFCPRYIPGELFASLMQRVRLSNDLPERDWERLLGQKIAATQESRDLGTALLRFSQLTKEYYGSARVLLQRSTLSLYVAAGNSVLLGLLARAVLDGEQATSPGQWPPRRHGRVRYCSECAAADRTRCGFPIAYKDQQLPFTRVCARHHRPLHSAVRTVRSVRELEQAQLLLVPDIDTAHRLALAEKQVLDDPDGAMRRLRSFMVAAAVDGSAELVSEALQRMAQFVRRPIGEALHQAFSLSARIGAVAPLSRYGFAGPVAAVLDAMGELQP
jgi:hypothetical protein